MLCEAAVVVCALKKRAFRRYLLLNLYMAFAVVSELGRYKILSEYGYGSLQYQYFYFYSDALLTIFLYFALCSLYSHVFSEMNAERYVRMGTLLLLAGTALFTYAVVQQSTAKLVTHFVVELSQNLYFVGLVLTYVLWGAIMKLRETRTRLIQLVLSLGVYFSLFAANYAVRNLYPSLTSVFLPLIQLYGIFLPLAWAYAFWRLPEEARLSPARLAVIPR
jgi:cation transport ATPase